MVLGNLPYYIASAVFTLLLVLPLAFIIFMIRWKMITRKVKKQLEEQDNERRNGETQEGEPGTQDRVSEEPDEGRVEDPGEPVVLPSNDA